MPPSRPRSNTGDSPASPLPDCLCPARSFVQRADAALEAFEQLGGDVVVKPLFGSEGRG